MPPRAHGTGLLPNRLCDENSKFRAKISKRDDAYLAKIRQGAVCNLQPKFRICSRSLLGNSPGIGRNRPG